MPQFDFSTFTPQLFWLVISFGLLLISSFLIITPRVQRVLETRHTNITEALNEAKKLRAQAEKMVGDADKELTAARNEAKKMLREVELEWQKIAHSEQAAMDEKLALWQQQSEARLKVAEAAALANISATLPQLLALTAGKLLGKAPEPAQLTAALANAQPAENRAA